MVEAEEDGADEEDGDDEEEIMLGVVIRGRRAHQCQQGKHQFCQLDPARPGGREVLVSELQHERHVETCGDLGPAG